MGTRCIMAVDAGTTSVRAVLVDERARPLAYGKAPVACDYPEPGWVEQDPDAIWLAVLRAVAACLDAAPPGSGPVAAMGLANQRETTILWDRGTGAAVYPAIGWQCRRTSAICAALRRDGSEALVRERTGLVLDPYFSAAKVAWILDAVPGLRRRAEHGDILFGTVDSWLTHRLTAGRVHVTDASNASRTSLFNIHTGQWDPDLLRLFRVPEAVLPTVIDTSGVITDTDPAAFGGRRWPIAALAGDQQAAMVGEGLWQSGDLKATFGTGTFVLMHAGSLAPPVQPGLLTTVAGRFRGATEYALEGSALVGGAAVQWLADTLGLMETVDESERLAQSVPDTGGVYLVPAFQGLGSPDWDDRARGTIVGLTRATTRAHVVRAALEALAYQTRDIIDAMTASGNWPRPAALRVDGGAAGNQFLGQFLADVLDLPVETASSRELTALGAAGLAGLATGLWTSRAEFAALWSAATDYRPQADRASRSAGYAAWRRAVARSRDWA